MSESLDDVLLNSALVCATCPEAVVGVVGGVFFRVVKRPAESRAGLSPVKYASVVA